MKSDAFESRVLSLNTNSPLGITKVKMCCGPHAVSYTRSICRTSHEILTFFFCDPRIRKGSAHHLIAIFQNSKIACGGGAAQSFDEIVLWRRRR